MKQIKLDYQGVDWWSRPIFKVTHSSLSKPLYVGSTNHLFDGNTPREEVIDFFKRNKGELEIMGTSFGCEPLGGSIKKSLKIVFKK